MSNNNKGTVVVIYVIFFLFLRSKLMESISVAKSFGYRIFWIRNIGGVMKVVMVVVGGVCESPYGCMQYSILKCC
jgi:hypothetical protein